MNKDENTVSAEQLAFLVAANQQLFAAAAAAAASTNVTNPSTSSHPPQISTPTQQQLQNNMMMSWLAGLSTFQSLQKPQLFENQHQQYASSTPAYPSTNASFGYPAHPRQAEPTYVNSKQYCRILKRRKARQILEAYFARTRKEREEKSYMHESRHRHALKRPRGPGGRFLTKDEVDQLKRESAKLEEEVPSLKKRRCESA